MLEFVFKKKEMLDLIDRAAADARSNDVVIRLQFTGTKFDFRARVTACCESTDDKSNPVSLTDEIDGCPRPPGCP